MQVSPVVLAVFIVIIIAAGVMAYFFYDQTVKLDQERVAVEKQLDERLRSLAEQKKVYEDLLNVLGWVNREQLLRETGGQADVKLEPLIQKELELRQTLVKGIGVDITDVDASGRSLYLENTINAALSGTTPEALQGTLVGNLVDALRQADQASRAYTQVVETGRTAVADLDGQIETKRTEIKEALTDWDRKIAEAWNTRMEIRERLIQSRKDWTVESAELSQKNLLAEAVLRKIEGQKEAQDNVSAPPQGTLLSYDWKSRTGVVSLGSREGVKRGYEFDLFHRFPGPDVAANRVSTGKVRIIETRPEVSLVAVIPSDTESEEHPIMVGDFITSPLFTPDPAKTFYLAGWFAPGSGYDAQTLAGMIRARGGVVQDVLQISTDFVVVGVVSEEGLADLSEEAKAAVAKAKADYELGKKFNATILTVDKFLTYISR